MKESLLHELFKEAAGGKRFPTGVDSIHGNELGRLADLVVRECIHIIEDGVLNSSGSGPWYDGYVSGAEECNRKIKEHFGVK